MNILDYVRMRGDISFGQMPLNEVDVLAMSTFVSLNLEGLTERQITFSELTSLYFDSGNEKDARDDYLEKKEKLIEYMSQSKRFKKVRLISFDRIIDAENEMTFYALTLQVNPFTKLVAFRGTDGSLMSWKENFNTLYQYPTAGQTCAQNYINSIKLKFYEKLIVCGHSKGGNLACYASAYCNSKIRDRIRDIYIYDGPGFETDLSQDADMNAIVDRIHGFIPVSSVVGRLMYVPFTSEVVESTGNGIYQHDVYNWQVGPAGFERADGVNAFSDSVSGKINSWIQNIPKERRKEVIDELFAVFESVGIDHSDKFTRMNIKTLIGLLRGIRSLSADNIKLLVIIMKEVMAAH
ncbi:MAG: DUF2974 domain-containing protein [Lachnospiraceae bacterium]|nr:DUF2974 domain-containing protein [Lachnospiraceae bacterium]